MRILYLHQYFCPPGGHGNNRSLDLARAWQAAGHQVTFITSPAYFPDHLRQDRRQYEIDVEGIRVIVLNVTYDHTLRFRQRIRAWLRFFTRAQRRSFSLPNDFDLVYASSTPLTIGELGRRIARRKDIPYIFECVDVWPDVPIGMGILRHRLLINVIQGLTDRIYRQAAAVVALSEGMREQILSHPVRPEKVHVVHNGTDPAAFPYLERPPRAGCHAIYTGTVGLANGVDFLVDVAERLHQWGRPDIRITVVGSGNDLERVQQYAAGKEVPTLEFKPRVPKEEVAGLLASADVGLVTFAPYPVLEANSANKFYDYLGCGLPVLLNYEGWQKTYLDAWECGFTAPQGDVDGFTQRLIQLADAPEDRRDMGQRGRKLVETHFDRRELAARLEALFVRVLTGMDR